MLDRLKSMLFTARNSVIVGFTATPLTGDDQSAKAMDLHSQLTLACRIGVMPQALATTETRSTPMAASS